MKSDHTNHYEATLQMHTGSITFARPSLGSWVSYGLGTMNRNLPGFIAIAPQPPYAGGQTWGSDFLPGCHQGTRVDPRPRADPRRRPPLPLGRPSRLASWRRSRHGTVEHLAARPGDVAA